MTIDWSPTTDLVGGGARWLGLCLVLVAAPKTTVLAQALPTSEDCRDCHLSLQDERLSTPARLYETDVHAETGFGCLSCHGSGGSDRLDPAAGFLSAPIRRDVPELCGRCHSDAAYMRQFNPGLRVDQVAEYWTSRHGQLLRETNDPDVATCIDCHPAHEIRPPDDPASSVYPANIVTLCGRCHADSDLMGPRGVPTDQVADYRSSVHGHLLLDEGDLSAPVCNDCHGNHGAAPPGLASVRNVCGQCHSVMADYFDQNGHEQIFQDAGLPGCETCHGNHAVQPVQDEDLVARSEDVCATCHEPPDTLGLQFRRIATVLDSLGEAEERSRALLEEAENAGMEVSQALFELQDLGNAGTRARNAIHTFRVEPVREEVSAGLEITARAEERGREALDEHRFRRVGLGVFSVVVLGLIIGLMLKIREYEDRMESLISQVEDFYRESLAVADRRDLTEQEIQLAAAALMLEVCHADGALTDVERSYLEGLARRRFGLNPQEAERLVLLAEQERGQPGQLDRIAAMIAGTFSVERKWALLDELWSLVVVDGTASAEEVEFMERLTHLLGVGPADSAAAIARGTEAVSRSRKENDGEETT